MNTIKKGIILTACALSISSAFAQDNLVNDPTLLTNNVEVSNQASLAGTDALPPKGANVYEKETTPLLREMSRKKAILEIRRLDSEIDKVENEIISRQAKPESNSRLINAQNIRNEPINVAPAQMQLPMAQAQAQVQYTPVRVLMTFGYDNDLFAKVSDGEQGGYVVKKGDILPSGQQVVSVRQNFIEVKAPQGSSKVQRIYVSGPETTTGGSSNRGAPMMMPFNDGTSNINPNLMAPMSQPGLVSVPTSVFSSAPAALPGQTPNAPNGANRPLPNAR